MTPVICSLNLEERKQAVWAQDVVLSQSSCHLYSQTDVHTWVPTPSVHSLLRHYYCSSTYSRWRQTSEAGPTRTSQKWSEPVTPSAMADEKEVFAWSHTHDDSHWIVMWPEARYKEHVQYCTMYLLNTVLQRELKSAPVRTDMKSVIKLKGKILISNF